MIKFSKSNKVVRCFTSINRVNLATQAQNKGSKPEQTSKPKQAQASKPAQQSKPKPSENAGNVKQKPAEKPPEANGNTVNSSNANSSNPSQPPKPKSVVHTLKD